MKPSPRLGSLIGAIALAGAIVALGTPPLRGSEPLAIRELAAAGQRVGRLSPPPQFLPGADASPPLFEIVAGNSDEVFRLDPRSGELFVARSGLLDFEVRRRYELTIRVRSGAAAADSAQRTFAADLLASSGDLTALSALLSDTTEFVAVVDVLDVDEPPLLEPQTITLVHAADDRSGASAWLRASDPESSTELRYQVLAGDPAAQLLVDEATGRIEIAPDRPVPPGQHVLPLTILVTDPAGNSDATTVLVRVVGLHDPRPAAPLASDVRGPETTTPVEPGTGAETAVDVDPEAPQPAADPITAAGPAAAPRVDPPAAVSDDNVRRRGGNRAALWYFICGILLGAGGMACVTGRGRRTSETSSPAPTGAPLRNPLHRVRPQPILYPPAAETPPLPAVAPTTLAESSVDRAEPPLPPPPPDASTFALPDESAPSRPTLDLRTIRDWQSDAPAVAPPEVEESSGLPDAPACEAIESPGPETAGMVPPAETPHEEPADVTHGDDARSFIGPESDDRAETGPGNDWFAADAAEHSPAAEPVDEEPAAGSDDAWRAVEPAALDVACAGEAEAEAAAASSITDEAPDRPDFERPVMYVTGADSSPPEPDAGAEAAWDAADAAAPAESNETAPELAPEPPGEEPRVMELRRQLTELFGVPADYQPPSPADPEEPAAERGVAVDPAEFAAPPEGDHVPARGVGADVVNLLDTWRARLNAELSAEEGDSSTSADSTLPDDVTADAFVLTPLTPETRLARSAAFELPPRVDKSAVRQEISSLRAVANTHARAVVARLSMETRARQVWLISGTCMVPLFSGGTYLLASMPPGPMRWLGWLMLTGGAAAFSVCLNSFNRLSKLHEEQEALLPDESAGGGPLKDTAEIEIPAELAAAAPAAPSEVEAAEPPQPASADAPAEPAELAAST